MVETVGNGGGVGGPRRWARLLGCVALLLVAVALGWRYLLWGAFVLISPFTVMVSNGAGEDIVSGRLAIYGSQHAIGIIKPGDSRSILIWAPSKRSQTDLTVTLRSGRVLRGSDELYAPYWSTQEWVVRPDGVSEHER